MSVTKRPRLLHFDTLALLGLRDADDSIDWAAVRAAQLNLSHQFAIFLLAANVLCAALAASFLRGAVSGWALIVWSGVVTATVLGIVFRRLAATNRSRVAAGIKDIRRTVWDGVALGAVWAIAPLWFGPAAAHGGAVGFWIVLAILTTASAVAMAAAPLATVVFLVLTGGTAAMTLALVVTPALGAAALLFSILLCHLCVTRGHGLLLARAQAAAIADRDEIVSLLLRESHESAADWLWETDAQRRIVRPDARMAKVLGTTVAALRGLPFLQALAGERWQTGEPGTGLGPLADRLRSREPFRNLLVQVAIDAGDRWLELAANPRFDDRGCFMGFRGVASDVTEARLSAARVKRMARYDTLTGLPNRLHINESLVQAIGEADKWGGRCAFMMIDLDRFKAVNDSLGHPVGDRLLGLVSERLRKMVTDNEIIGRLGGDEFAVVVRDARDRDRIEALARTIITELSQPYDVDRNILYIGASVGLAIGPRDGRTAETLIRSADLALYRSKDAGGGTFHAYQPELHAAAEERRVLEIALRGALQNDELHLDFQPVVDAHSEKLTGFEALLRWTHPELGPISPARFMPLAREARLIAPIGEWVIRNACAQAARCDDSIRIAVNISAEQLQSSAFVTVVTQALAQSGVRPDRLELEVTESVFMREGTAALRSLEQLLALGCQLTLDDFGTGYSALGYLSATRFSTIKIDGSFVQAAANGARESIAIIRAAVALAESLGMVTTAEGVETAAELAMIRALGCTRAQGHYFGRPLPAGEASALAIARSAAAA